MSYTTHQTPGWDARSGASIVELFGCMAALGCGIVLGSLYLGIDVGTVAVRALGGEPTAVDAEGDGQEESLDEEQAEQEKNASESTDAVADDAGDEEPAADLDEEDQAAKLTNAAATREYWIAMTAVLDRESGTRTERPSASEGWQLFDYIVSRRDAHAETVEQLQQLPSAEVDQRLLDFAGRVEDWHQRGADLYARAADLLTDSGSSDLGGPVAQSWQSAATQHRMEERLLLERRQTLARYVRRHAAESE